MMVITYVAFLILSAICSVLHYIIFRTSTAPVIGNNPLFLSFQRGFFTAYLTATFADWLQGPYLYKLYSHYGFQEDQIAVLYVCGFASSVIFGTWAPIAADRYGRKALCLLFTIIYSVTCLLKLSTNYWVLALGRIFGGLATSLLFSAFETWYVHEHIETHDFPTEWIPVTFTKATKWNGALAVVAGIVANVTAEWMKFGPVAPFIVAIPFLVIAGIVVSTQWEENYAKQPIQFGSACCAGLRSIVTEPRILLIGIIQSLFEAAMYIFVFLWTPVLAPAHASLGITFSSFMVCIMIGSAIYQVLSTKHVSPLHLLGISIAMALVGNLLCVAATHPDNTQYSLAFIAFLLIEISVGMYFPSMAFVRSVVVPEKDRRSVVNWSRVPLHLITCILLLMLHNQTYRHGNRLLFASCSCLLTAATISILQLIKMVRNDEEMNFSQDGQLMAMA